MSRSSCRRRAPTSPAARRCCGSCCRRRRPANFTQTKLAPTIVAGLVPEDGFGSTALVSQAEMLAAAGEDIFNFIFVDFYGTNQDAAADLEHVPGRRLVGRGPHHLAAGDHRPASARTTRSPRSWWSDELRPLRRRRRHRRSSPRRAVAIDRAAGRSPPAQADVRLRQLHGRVPRRCPWRSCSCSWSGRSSRPIYYAMTDWTGFQANFNFIGFDNFTSLWDDELSARRCGTTSCMAIVVPFVTIVDLLDVRHDDHDRRFESRATCAGSGTPASTAWCRSFRTSSRRS